MRVKTIEWFILYIINNSDLTFARLVPDRLTLPDNLEPLMCKLQKWSRKLGYPDLRNTGITRVSFKRMLSYVKGHAMVGNATITKQSPQSDISRMEFLAHCATYRRVFMTVRPSKECVPPVQREGK
ncbi:hypothetical protein DPMN_027405 [Dreissena polymorpha]|uniref:Uncharacterized protein n=1 Tax=Dreissena polymorpha TaxID=45954 RepID=A0A9D4RD93_DREPO|nr:hypothetical protein DPMN_027212 [Dreissena polymorpha]KAH3864388.1 hypothetical protein DPMN_027405 [Dreissena polymorpha]